MASRKRKPSNKTKRARGSAPSVAGLREVTSPWSDASEALFSGTDDDASQPILLWKKAKPADALDDDFFSKPISFQHSIAVGQHAGFADLEQPPDQQRLTPAMRARRRKLRSMVTAVVGLAALILTVGIAKQAMREVAPASATRSTAQETTPALSHTVGRPQKRMTAGTLPEHRQRSR